MDRFEFDRRKARVLEIQEELRHLSKETHPSVTRGSIGIWIASGGLGVVGVVLALPSGGLSLLLSGAGMVLFMVDMARQIQATAATHEVRRHAQVLAQELLDHLQFIIRFGVSGP